jgi:hypothetical protein
MQSISVLGVIAAAAVVASSAGLAQAAAAISSAQPDPLAREIAWRTTAAASPLSPGQLLRECQRVVAVIGPVTRYVSRGQELEPRALARCNRYAVDGSLAIR